MTNPCSACSEYDELMRQFKELLTDLEYWYGRANPEWNREAAPFSTIGRARELVRFSEAAND